MDLLHQYPVALRVFLDLGDHDFVEQIHLPELLIVTVLLVILGIN